EPQVYTNVSIAICNDSKSKKQNHEPLQQLKFHLEQVLNIRDGSIMSI
ncbi:4550_t:CDS:1, partial [Funneliformis mosseae]